MAWSRFIVGLVLTGMFAAASTAPGVASAAACCHVRAGTEVEVALAEPISTKTQKSGQSFALRLAAPLIVNGRILLRAGAPGVGQVVEASGPGMGGKGAKLVLAARYLQHGKARLPLDGLQMAGSGRSNATASTALGLTGIVFAPLGFVGLAVKGGDVTLPAGTTATARLTLGATLPSLGRAPPGEAAAEAAAEDATVTGLIRIPPPPHGMGQVVFFRPKSLLGTAQWFKVRENGQALGKLTNGAYFVQVVPPGSHTYTATYEPELKDHLTLEIAAGETYFVEGETSRALVLGAADLAPSDEAAFERAAKDLKPAPPLSGG